MEFNTENLICPVCNKNYNNYKEYFKCWTSHLDRYSQEETILDAPKEHALAVNYYKRNPNLLEDGLRILASEVGVFRGRIDLLGADKEGNLVIIDITKAWERNRKTNQLTRYRRNIEWMATRVFGITTLPKIRLILVNFKGEKQEIN